MAFRSSSSSRRAPKPGRKAAPSSSRDENRKQGEPSRSAGDKNAARAGKTGEKRRADTAKKMVLRRPNREIRQKSQHLRDLRRDLAGIEPMRLQKILAASGLGSRRAVEEMIGAGLVQVNGKKARLGDKVTPGDKVSVRGSPVRLFWPDRLPRILLYYKQEGEIVSRDDPEGRLSVFDRLPQVAGSRWVVIGRLDINTSGLLIFTTSGELANRFAHPGFAVDREYRVRASGELSDAQMEQLTGEGIMLDDGPVRVARIVAYEGEGKNRRYDVVIREGRNREVRRIFEHFGLTVAKLTRVRFGPVAIPPRLKRGQFYELNEVETAYVLKEAGMDLPQPGPDKKRVRAAAHQSERRKSC